MTVYENILYKYGAYILLLIRGIAEQNELYEDCAEINQLFDKYKIDKNMTAADWVQEFWKQGTSGQVAMQNAPFYFIEAIGMCVENGKFKDQIEGI